MKEQYDFPQTIKRGLMRAVVHAGSVVQNTEQYYWSRTLEALHNRYTQLVSGDNFMSSYHEERIKVQIIDILESCIGNISNIYLNFYDQRYIYFIQFKIKLHNRNFI